MLDHCSGGVATTHGSAPHLNTVQERAKLYSMNQHDVSTASNTSPNHATKPPTRTPIQATDLALISGFAAFIIVLGAVSIPVGSLGVPIVLQNMGVLLAALLLGVKRSTLTTLLFLGVGLVGIPNLAGWRTTLSALPGNTVGYLVGYILTAIIAAWIASKAPSGTIARFMTYTFAGIVGTLLQFVCGALGLVWRMDLTFWDAFASNAPFVLGGVFKIIAASAIAIAVQRSAPQIFQR